MRLTILPVVLLFVLSSCRFGEPEQPMTKKEALELSAAIDSAIRYKKPLFFNSLINEKVFAAKVGRLSGEKVSGRMITEVKNSLAKTTLGNKIIEIVKDHGSYELVKYYEKNKTHHLIFRLYSEGGLNYHDFELTKRNDKVAIADIFVYLSGEDLSKTIADLMVSFSESSNGNSSELDKQIKVLDRIRTLMGRNKIEEALSYYEDLPPALKDQKTIKQMYVQLCSEKNDGSYEKAMSEFQELYGDEPNMFLMMMDVYVLRKEYDKALEGINKLDMLIDSDPFLDYMRALLYNMMDKPGKARDHLEKLYARMPDFDDGALELIANYIVAGEEKKAKQLIKEYRSHPEFDQESLDTYLYFQPQYKSDAE